MNYPQHIIDHANKMVSMGTKMTFEAICEMQIKSEAKKAKKSGSKKEEEKAQSRRNVENAVDSSSSGFIIGGVDYGTQADYQRSCMGTKWAK